MQKIKASGIPFCGSYRDAIAEKEYNIDQCNVRIAELEAINADLLNLLTAADRLEELTGENLAVYARTYAALARAAIARATGGNAS